MVAQYWPWPLVTALALLASVAAALPGDALDAGSVKAATLTEAQRRLQLDEDEMLDDDSPLYESDMHAQYSFSLMRENMPRSGQGEFWLSFRSDKGPQLRLRGAASSTRFGEGEITIVVNSIEKVMYALFKMKSLAEVQCLKYPFPDPKEEVNAQNLDHLHWRKEQVMKWKEEEEEELLQGDDYPLLEVNWTKSYMIQFLLDPKSKHVSGLDLKERGSGKTDRVIKNVRLSGVEVGKNVAEDPTVFDAPYDNCTDASLLSDPLARVALRPPHKKSSALNDLLLLMQEKDDGEQWPQLFVLLSAITVPGDVAVLIEDPPPPNMAALHNVRFDYSASLVSQGERHTSNGSIWLGLDKNIFRLRGEASKTKVGPLVMDLIAQGGDGADSKVYANVNLTVEDEHQCVVYDYPTVERNVTEYLEDLANQGLTFFSIAELDGEDCGIFVAPLQGDRWLHVWVDMERAQQSMILRTEVHRGGEVLRSTDILGWSTGEDVSDGIEVGPEWGCQAYLDGEGQLASLGLERPHKRSLDLQDALYALKEMHKDYALLEVLGLTGNVGIMVQEPTQPELWQLSAVTFTYSVHLANTDVYVDGVFAAELKEHQVIISAMADFNITVALDPDVLAVRMVDPDGKTSCLTLPVNVKEEDLDRPNESVGIFDGVEAIGKSECNRFSFIGEGPHQDSVDFWFSMQEQKVCRLEVVPTSDGVAALVDVPEWHQTFVPPGGADPKNWHCSPAGDDPDSWLAIESETPPALLPEAIALGKLTEASGVVGLLPGAFSNILSRIVIRAPSRPVADMPGDESSSCTDFSGSWQTIDTDTILLMGGTDTIISQSGCQVKTSAGKGGIVSGNTITIESQSGTLEDNAIEWSSGRLWIRKQIDSGTTAKSISVLSDSLTSLSFSFKSAYPLAGGDGLEIMPDGKMSYTPTAGIGERRRSSQGQIRIDLANRMLVVSSEATNVSAGILKMSSKIIVRGDQGRMFVHSFIESGLGPDEDYDQCWMVNITRLPDMLDGDQSKQHPNPFAFSDHAGDCTGADDGGVNCAEKRVSWLDSNKRLEFFIDDAGRLTGMVLDDVESEVAVGVVVWNFSTEPLDPKLFEPTVEWKCLDLKALPDAERVAEWDLIRVFFPVELEARSDETEEQRRRLFAV